MSTTLIMLCIIMALINAAVAVRKNNSHAALGWLAAACFAIAEIGQ